MRYFIVVFVDEFYDVIICYVFGEVVFGVVVFNC